MNRRSPWFYHAIYWHTGQYLEQFVAPLLFLFACFTLILSSMQVAFAALPQDKWTAFSRTSYGFSIAMIIFIAVVFFISSTGVVLYLAQEAVYGIRLHKQKTRPKKQKNEPQSTYHRDQS